MTPVISLSVKRIIIPENQAIINLPAVLLFHICLTYVETLAVSIIDLSGCPILR